MDFNVLSIFRPGLITGRDNDSRIGEKIFSFVPFIPKISSPNLAKAIQMESELLAERTNLASDKETYVYSNSQIKSIIK